MLTAKGFLVSFLHFWISLRRSSGVGKMRAVMMPSPPALETALASSAYPTYWNKSSGSVFHRVSIHHGEAVRPVSSHRGGARTWHLSDMSRRMGTLEVAKEQLADSGHVPSYRLARRALWFSSVECLQVGSASARGVCLPRVAYSPRMPRRRVSSVFHGMLLVLSGGKAQSEEGSRGLCCSFRR